MGGRFRTNASAKELRERAEKRPWWMWVISDRTTTQADPKERPFLSGAIAQATLPYVWTKEVREELPEGDRDWGLIGLHHVYAHQSDEAMRQTFINYFRQWHPSKQFENSNPDLNVGKMGSMITVRIDLWLQGRKQVIFTPPIYKFCDLDKEFPELEQTNLVRPFDFWVQPETYLATGEIMQGSPIYRDNLHSEGLGVRELAQMIADRKQREDVGAEYIEWLEFVHVALDSWVERYERTGETKAKDDFVFSFAEARRRAAKTPGSPMV